jgi:hypothetical protein
MARVSSIVHALLSKTSLPLGCFAFSTLLVSSSHSFWVVISLPCVVIGNRHRGPCSDRFSSIFLQMSHNMDKDTGFWAADLLVCLLLDHICCFASPDWCAPTLDEHERGADVARVWWRAKVQISPQAYHRAGISHGALMCVLSLIRVCFVFQPSSTAIASDKGIAPPTPQAVHNNNTFVSLLSSRLTCILP